MRDGLRGFYRGCGTNLVRTVPAAAITFTTFELAARQLRVVGKHHQRLLEAEMQKEDSDAALVAAISSFEDK